MKFVINLFFVLSCIQSQAQTVLRFQAHITPQAQYLGDLLIITPDLHHWSKLTLDSQPKHEEHLTKQQVIGWMERKLGLFHYQWRGKNTATVIQNSQTSAQELLNKAQMALSNQLKKQGYGQVTIKSKSLLKDSPIVLADFKAHTPKDNPVAKRACVYLQAKNHSIPVWFSVHAYEKVWVAKKAMNAHTIVHSNDFILKKQDIAGLKAIPLIKIPATIWLNKSLSKNQILTQNHSGKPPEIMQGQTVKVTVKQQHVSIMMEALAQNDGYKGEMIQMKNPQTNQYFSATITGKNMAEIAA